MQLNKHEILRRIIDISYRHRCAHLSSNLTTAGILCDIYGMREPDDPVVLSNGHAGLALYVVLESALGMDAEALFARHGTHPNRDVPSGIYVTTGSLGMGLPVALGMAIASRDRNVFCIISDGECAEGSVWEALAVKTKYDVRNLNVFANLNGFSSYDPVNQELLAGRLRAFDPELHVRNTRCNLPFAAGYRAHYHVLNAEQYHWLLNHLEEVA